MISMILLNLITILNSYTIIAAENVIPKFCETKDFDEVFYMKFNEYKLHIKSGKWVWNVAKERNQVVEPPHPMKELMKEIDVQHSLSLKTTLYISKAPICNKQIHPSYTDDDCKRISNAKDLIIFRFEGNGDPLTSIYRYIGDIKNPIFHQNDFPWNLNINNASRFWPSGASVALFHPYSDECYFIASNGDKHKSRVLVNDISTKEWYENLKAYKLNSDVKFVGMFYDTHKVLAVGYDPKDNNRRPQVYELKRIESIGSIKLINTNKSLTNFFGCYDIKGEVQTVAPKTEQTTDGRQTSEKKTLSETRSEGKGKSGLTIVIIVVAIVFILIISISIVIFIFIKTKGVPMSTPGVDDRKSKDKSKSQEDIATRIGSIDTIHSDTGLSVKSKN